MQATIRAEAALDARHFAYARRRELLGRSNIAPTVVAADWPTFWDQVNSVLRASGYAQSTRLQFRQVLRGLRRAGMQRPTSVSRLNAHRFICDLADSGASWSWIALHITVFRTVFDRLCGKSVTRGMVTPKRGLRLPDILSESEAERLIEAGGTIRDQLLLGLMYGCGLAGSETVNLRWRDVLGNGKHLRVARSTRYLERVLPVPKPLRQLLDTGASTCESDQYIFRGRSEGSHLSTRMVELIVRCARESAGIARPVCVMTLRHSYAVHRLENGASLPCVQHEIGHASIRTTERYVRCLAPRLEPHPFTTVRGLMQKHGAQDSKWHATQESLQKGSAAGPSRRGSERADQARVAQSSKRSAKTFDEAPRPLASLQSTDIEALHLPFPPGEELDSSGRFFRLLTTRLLHGILCRKRPRSP